MLPWFLCADVRDIVDLLYVVVHGGEGQSFGHQLKPDALQLRTIIH